MSSSLRLPLPLQTKIQQLRWMAGFILLFVFTQMVGVVHAEIHAFHEHQSSCDLFENLVQPVDKVTSHSIDVFKSNFEFSGNVKLVSVHEAVYQPFVYGRAPPLA